MLIAQLVGSGDFKVVVRLGGAGVGIRRSGMRSQVLIVRVLLGILYTAKRSKESPPEDYFLILSHTTSPLVLERVLDNGLYTDLLRTQEEQMLDRMRHAGHVIVVGEIAHIDVDRGTGLVRVGVMHQQGFELVRQPNHPVRAIVQLGPLEIVRHAHDALGHGVVDCFRGRQRCKGPGSGSSSSKATGKKKTARRRREAAREQSDRKRTPSSMAVPPDSSTITIRREHDVPIQ